LSRRLVLLSALFSVCAVAYFLMLDKYAFSSRGFAPIFHYLLVALDARAVWLVLAICLAASVWNRPAGIIRLVDWLGHRPIGLAAACATLISFGSVLAYHAYPLCMDEYAAIFQAKTFASGHVVATLPPALVNWLIVPGFNGEFLVASPVTGRAVESYWPGFALLLAPFEFVGAPWLCNALLGGLAIYLIFRITIEVTGNRRAAGWAMLFGVASSAFFANAISFYSMQAHMTLNLLFAWLLLRPTKVRALIAGFVGSFALVLHNPVPHTLFAAPWIVALVVDKDRRRLILPLALGYLPLAITFGLGWLSVVASVAPASGDVPLTRALASGIFRWPDMSMLNMRIAALVKMWTWAVPGLFLFAIWGAVTHRGNPQVRLLAQSALLTFVAYLFINLDQGHGWGYRYFHSAWGVIPVLAGCAMANQAGAKQRLESFAGAACILSLLFAVPFQIDQINQFISRHLHQLPQPRRPGNNIFLVNVGGSFYLADLIQNDPRLKAPDLFLAGRGRRVDADFMRRMWPSATKIAEGTWGEQWYLNPSD
jgi:hypothetical protein